MRTQKSDSTSGNVASDVFNKRITPASNICEDFSRTVEKAERNIWKISKNYFFL